ncbi:MAG: hypothetical protein KGR99_17095 [Betaproteobacteria bacterium]|nr:hypothetical protein [Betaproteobacteria bacterium]
MRLAPHPTHHVRTVKKWLLVGGVTLLVALILGIWGLFAIGNLVSERLPQWTEQGRQAIGVVVQQADESLPGVRGQVEALAPGVTSKVDDLLGRPPAQDVGGEDVAGMPRYPGMVRTAYRNVDGRRTVTYQRHADFADVLQFYRDATQRNGWTATVLEGSAGREVRSVSQGARRLEVTVSRGTIGKLTTVTVAEQ